MAVNPLIHHISRRFEDVNINPQKEGIELPLITHQMYTNHANETMVSNGSVALSEMIGDEASTYSSLEDFCEVPVITGPNGLIPSNGGIYTGPPVAMVDTHEYMQCPMDGMHYYNPMVDYNYGIQPIYGGVTVSTDMHYPLQRNDAYVYDHQVYQYPIQPYYQQDPVAQYGYGGDMVVLDPHEQSVPMPNVYNNLVGSIPVSFDTCEDGSVAVMLPYPSQVSYPPQTLRASAPAWNETSSEAKNLVKSYKSEVSQAHQLLTSNKGNNKMTNGTSLKNSLISGKDDTVSAGTLIFSADSKGSINSKLNKKEDNQSIDTGYGIEFPALRSALPVKSTHSITKVSATIPQKDSVEYGKYNAEDFFIKYEDARFFIIKSYSEENVYRSIQYGVWASTPNGNKKLDDAYRDAQGRAVGKPHGCPVLLFFSVNGSRQFCGVAEMVGHVDYKKSMEFWEQHKWSGSFPVVWRCIKDVPNSMFRRFILQNNENKPVTNSRDTQEVILAQGLEMLNIMKSYPAKTSIMDEIGNALARQIPAKPIAQLKLPKQLTLQTFLKTGQRISGEHSEDMDLRPSNGATVPNVSEKEPQPKKSSTLLVKSLHSKVLAPNVATDRSLGKDRQKVNDKENIKLIVKESVLAAA